MVVGSFAVFLIYAPIVWLGVMSVSERPLSGIPWPLGSVWYDELFRDTRKWLPPLGAQPSHRRHGRRLLHGERDAGGPRAAEDETPRGAC